MLAFGDEEGSRFPVTLTSSSACAGVFDNEELASADANGVTVAEALRAYGKDPKDIAAAAYRSDEAAGYIEVHIEQGPVLESKGEPLGIVTGIVGQVRLRVTVTGEAGHAGTVPMNLRHDAYAGAAEMALALEKIAREHPEDGMVGTVGRIEAVPGAVNIIPGRVLFTVDLRSLTDALRVEATERFAAEAARIAKARGLTVSIETFHEIATAHCAPALQDALAASVTELGHTPIRLPSGAGHDAQVMARLCPVGDAVRALPRRHQSQSGGVRQRCRHGSRHCGTHQIHRTVQTMSDFIERNFSREVELLKALVRVPSDNPPGDCARHGEAAAKLFEGLGFKVERHPVPAEFVKKHGMVSVTNLVIRERFGSGKGADDRAQRPWRCGSAGTRLEPRSLRRGGTRRRDLRPRRRGVEVGFRELWLRAAGAEGQSGRARRHGGTASDL